MAIISVCLFGNAEKVTIIKIVYVLIRDLIKTYGSLDGHTIEISFEIGNGEIEVSFENGDFKIEHSSLGLNNIDKYTLVVTLYFAVLICFTIFLKKKADSCDNFMQAFAIDLVQFLKEKGNSTEVQNWFGKQRVPLHIKNGVNL